MDDVRTSVAYFATEAEKRASRMADTISLNSKDETENNSPLDDYDDDAAEEFDEDNDVINEEKQSLMNIAIALKKARIMPYREEPYIVQIFVSNENERLAVDNIRKDLVQFIIKRLHYDRLKIEIFAEQATQRTVYSAQEKYNLFVSRSPALKKLRDYFNCELKM